MVVKEAKEQVAQSTPEGEPDSYFVGGNKEDEGDAVYSARRRHHTGGRGHGRSSKVIGRNQTDGRVAHSFHLWQDNSETHYS